MAAHNSPMKNGARARRIAVLVHRWVGLALAAFLFMAGLTGSVIAFHHELDRWINPEVLTVEPTSERLPAKEWIAAAEEAHPKARVIFVTLPQAEDEPVVCFLAPRQDPSSGEIYDISDDQVFVNPATAEVLGSRDRDGFHFDRLHAIPFIYTLHYSLHLGQWGMWILGVLALVWFFDCFVGLYLAWPQRAWRAIKRALTVKWGASAGCVTYDLHRAGGLWAWVLLLILAFSGMSMNLHEEVFDPLMETVSPMTPWPGDVAPARDDPQAPMSMPVAAALNASQEGLAESDMDGELGAIWLNYAKGLYHLGYHTSGDYMSAHPGAWVTVSSKEAEVVDVRPPGGHKTGDVIHDLQFPLHSGKIAGLPGRIVISLSGLAVAMLSVTGVLIWWRKRRGRSLAQSKKKTSNKAEKEGHTAAQLPAEAVEN